jgi:hypothetical protein
MESLEKSKFKKLKSEEMKNINGGYWKFIKQSCKDGVTINNFQQIRIFGGATDNWMQTKDAA